MILPPDIAFRLASRPASEPPRTEGLPPAERDRAATFGSAKRRREFVLGRVTARTLLAEHLALAEPDVPLRIGEDGAPEIEGVGLHLSITHASTAERSFAAAAVAPHPVGVDLEVIRPRRPDLYRFVLHPDEYGLLDALPHDHDAAQVLLWTLKEAALKAMRTGFRCSPKKLRLSIEPGQRSGSVRVEDGGTWALRYAEGEGTFVAVAFPD